MAWESRGRSGKLYYYECRRTADGRVVKTYRGRGGRADQAVAAVEGRRQARLRDREAVGSEAARLSQADRLTEQVGTATDILMRAFLVAGGWHRVNYGPWRRKRNEPGRASVAGATGRDPGRQRPGPGG